MIFRFLIYSSLLLLISPMSVIARYPHDKKCYTQGFQFINETTLVESCGLYALSRVKFLDADKLNDILVRNMHQKVFGEGVTKFKGLIYVLTWREHQVYVYSEKLELQKVIRWDKQGWGLTHNETHMFVTDGTSNIYIVQESFKVVHMITVTHNNNPVIYLNELEYYKGNLLANIYMKHIIVEIDINTGQVIKQYDLKEIVQEQNRLQALRSDFVLNGIAYLNTTDKLLVTGKMWSQVYEIKL